MPPSRNNTVKFSDLAPISAVGISDLIPVVDTSVPTLVNKKINVQDFSRSLPVSLQITQLGANSANWDSSYSTTQANSASWGTGGSYGSVYSANSAEYESTYSNVNTNSANWSSTYSTVQASSAAWVGLTTFTTVNSLSDNWNTGYTLANSSYTTLSTLSTGYWVLKSGDQLTGALTTTRTVTANFTLDELVTKRYVDAMATATQISGNFVPNLYYTKSDLQTGIPLLSSLVLQTNSLAIGQEGASQTGIISFDANQYGTGVTGYTFNSTGNRSGLRVICGTYARFNVSEQGLSFGWGGPTFQQGIFSLGDSSGTNSVMIVDHYGPYHAAPLTNSVVLRCSNPHNFFIRNYSNIFLDVPTISGHSFIADQYAVQNDSRIYNAFGSPAAHNIQFASNNFFFTGNGVRTLSIAENIAPGNGGIWMRSDRIVGWSSSGDPGNTGDLRLKRIGTSSLALDSGGTANIPSFTVFGDISAGRDMFSTSLQSNSNLLLSAVGNITLSAASIRLSQSLPFYFSSLSASKLTFDRSGNATSFSNPLIAVPSNDGTYFLSDGYSHIRGGPGPSIIFGSYGDQGAFATRINGATNTWNLWLTRDSSICWGTGIPNSGFTETGDLFLFKDAPYVLAIRDRQAQTNTNALRIYNTYTDANNYSRLSLSGSQIVFERAGTGPSANFNINNGAWNLSWANNGLIAERNNIQMINLAAINRVVIHRDYALAWSENPYTDQYSGDTFLYRDGAGILALNNGASPGVYRIYNTYTNANNYERLSLSATRIAYEAAGTGVSRDLTIQSTGNIVLSAGGRVNISQSLPVYFNSLSAGNLVIESFSNSNFGVPSSNTIESRLTDFGSNSAFWNGTRFYVTQAGRIHFKGSNGFDVNFYIDGEDYGIRMGGAIAGIATYIRGGTEGSGFIGGVFSNDSGSIGFLNGAGANTSQLTKDLTLNRDAADRLALRRTTNSQEFRVYNTFTNLFNFERLNVSPTTIRQEISGTGTRRDLTIYSTRNLILSAGVNSTVTQITSAGDFSTTGLICLGGTTASNAAIKGSGTTVVAKLGDDSDYAFLQGKLQTLNTAAAGTFTPDRYLILYDSTGTAYKVPVQAL